MRQNIHLFSSRTQHREKGKRCGDGDPGATPRSFPPAAPRERQAAEHPNSAENRSGGSYRNVSRAVDERVDEIAAGAGEQNQSRSDSEPQHAG